MKNKKKLRIEIIQDPIKKETRVLIWEGLVIVDNTILEGLLEPTLEAKAEIENKYFKELTKES